MPVVARHVGGLIIEGEKLQQFARNLLIPLKTTESELKNSEQVFLS
jgi:hypothetical protein